MPELLSFFIILTVGLLVSEVFRRLHLPWVAALIITGVVIGPFGLGWFAPNDTTAFIGQIGLVFLMFMAGLETRLSTLTEQRRGLTIMILLNGLTPLLVGIAIGQAFGYSWIASLLLGTVFVSSSIAVVIPSLAAHHLLNTKLGKLSIATTMVQDVISLVMLSVILQSTDQAARIPLPLFYLMLLIVVVLLRWYIPILQKKYLPRIFKMFETGPADLFQRELRFVFVILLGTVIIFELLGLHAIIAGFFAGLVVSESIQSEKLIEKIRVMSYGVFIPVFFVVVGAQTNMGELFNQRGALYFTAIIVLGSFLSKFISGYVGGRLLQYEHARSLFLGASTTPQLTTTLAAVFSGFALGLFDQRMVVAMIVLSLITSVASPSLLNYFVGKYKITS